MSTASVYILKRRRFFLIEPALPSAPLFHIANFALSSPLLPCTVRPLHKLTYPLVELLRHGEEAPIRCRLAQFLSAATASSSAMGGAWTQGTFRAMGGVWLSSTYIALASWPTFPSTTRGRRRHSAEGWFQSQENKQHPNCQGPIPYLIILSTKHMQGRFASRFEGTIYSSIFLLYSFSLY